MAFLLTRSSSFVDRDFIILRSRLLTEPRILVREYGTIPVDPRMMQVTRAAFQAVASLNEQATDPKSHTLVRILFTAFS
jgi:hypothetical protein